MTGNDYEQLQAMGQQQRDAGIGAIEVGGTPQPLDINEITEQWLFGDSPNEAAPPPALAEIERLRAVLADVDERALKLLEPPKVSNPSLHHRFIAIGIRKTIEEALAKGRTP